MKQKHKNYIQLDQLKKIKKTKNGLKRNIKMQLNRNEKIPYVQVKQNNGKKKVKNPPPMLHHLHQRRGVLRTLSNIHERDFYKNGRGP